MFHWQAKGTARRSFTTRFLESAGEDTTPQEVDDVRSIIGNMYIGILYHPHINCTCLCGVLDSWS